MSTAVQKADAPADTPKKGGKLGLILGIVGALALGGGGFFAIYSGMIPLGGGGGHDEHAPVEGAASIAFVPMEPIMVSLPRGGQARMLRFTGQLEVAPEHQAEVAGLMPRVLDVLNTYLRAVEVKDLEDPAALARLRAQMLRRLQVVTGEGRVNDLLITEFVLN